MARKIEFTRELLESVRKSIGFVAGIYRQQWSEEKIFVSDLVSEIIRLKEEIEVLKHGLSGEGESAKEKAEKFQGPTGIQRDQDE